MKPTPAQLAYCLAQATRFIPDPPKKAVRAQLSKWGMKVGQLLASPVGEHFKVVEVDSSGLTLETPDLKVCRVESQEEISKYSKVRARRKAKGLPEGTTGEV